MAEYVRPYQRLQSALAGLIAATPAGQRLPSEPELARQMGVSRATLREAMRAFEGQGLIRRKQGVGTFVVGRVPVFESGLEVLESIETLAEKIHLKVTMGALQVIPMEANENQATELGVSIGSPLIEVRRVILAERRPVAYLIDLLPQDVLSPEDLKADFTGSVLDLLLQRGMPPLAHSRTEISAVSAQSEIARALEIQRGDVLLSFRAHLFSTDGRVVDYSTSYFLPGYFRFHVMRSVGASGPASWLAVEQERRQNDLD